MHDRFSSVRSATCLAAGFAVFALAAGACVPTDDSASTSDSAAGSDDGGGVVVQGSDGEDGANGSIPDGRSATLIRVIDGDSLELELDGVETEVRLLGINAPELFQPAAEGPDVRTCNGDAATDALVELLSDRPLTLVGDEEDRFGRLLAEVYTDQVSVTEAMVDDGWALARNDAPDLGVRMAQAAGNGLGIWGSACGVPQAEGLRIGETQIDPPGPDGDRLVSEWVTIVNDGSESVDLTGWEIRDDTTSNRFVLQGTIEVGATLRIRTGAGPSSDEDLYLGEQFPVWSNGGDTVILSDPTGVVAAWAFVSGS